MTALAGLLAIAMLAGSQAPVPRALREAQTAYLTSQHAQVKKMDELAKELRAWRGLRLVDTREDADIVITLTQGRSETKVVVPAGGMLFPLDETSFGLSVHHRSTDEQLWSDQGTSVKKLVKTLADRVSKAAEKGTRKW